MPRARIRFNPEAALEVEAAFDWYLERNPQAAQAFLNELDHAITRVSEACERWPRYTVNTRRYVFARFPFQLIYRSIDNSVEIIAVAHGRRRPGYWKHRL